MNVAIIGCGLIGRKRAGALASSPNDALTVVCDVDQTKAASLARDFHCQAETRWQDVVVRKDVDIVVNSSINQVLEPITVAALSAGKHVLCEKPLGRNVGEARRMIDAAQHNNRLLKPGFNHIFHPALWKAKKIVEEGAVGDLLTIRARYGHGSRPGMEKEWRSSKTLCGGGELLDQGVHVIDLIRWFAGDVLEVYCKAETKFWNIEVEDNAYAILTCHRNVTALFHVSWTNWLNVFSFEIFGTKGYLLVNGLGGSYGTETLEFGRRNPEGGRPETQTFVFEGADTSWSLEWQEFRTAIVEARQPLRNGMDGLRANQVIEALYESAKANAPVAIPRA
jgi:predicted dehydrogenase